MDKAGDKVGDELGPSPITRIAEDATSYHGGAPMKECERRSYLRKRNGTSTTALTTSGALSPIGSVSKFIAGTDDDDIGNPPE
jgi:hypothetical protein